MLEMPNHYTDNFVAGFKNFSFVLTSLLPQLKVPSSEKTDVSVNFRNLLLDRCQKEFEKDQNDNETLDKKQNELVTAKDVRNNAATLEKKPNTLNK